MTFWSLEEFTQCIRPSKTGRSSLEEELFFQKSLEYLGHNISKEGVRPTDERVKCVLEAPPPQNKQQLKSFLGLTTYNAKFLPSLSHVLHPLNKLLKKNVQWKWTEEEKKSFDAVKAMVADKQCLAHYDVSKPLKVYSHPKVWEPV